MKTDKTIVIEKILKKSLFGSNPKLAKEYGGTEVTIGFQRDKHQKQIVDFMSYDPKNAIFRCYEIKVSTSDFRSKAMKSWVGHFNYLVLTEELFDQQSLDVWKSEIPDYVGIIVVNITDSGKKTIKKAARVNISDCQSSTLKDSLIRTLFYQNQNPNWYLR